MAKQIQPPPESNQASKELDIPTYDFFENFNLDEPDDLDEALDNLIFGIKSGYFLCWEAVVRKEQDLPLSMVQAEILTKLVNLFDQTDGHIFYINDLPRPSELWYEIARKIVPRFIQDPFRTDVTYYEIVFDGWPTVVDALDTYCRDLSLPEGIDSPFDIFPPSVQHRLNLQLCLDELHGLGQDEEMTLANEEQLYRIDDFISVARGYKDSVQYLGLTLEKLLKKVIMPPKDEKIFIDNIMVQLGMNSKQEQLANFLRDENFAVTSFWA